MRIKTLFSLSLSFSYLGSYHPARPVWVVKVEDKIISLLLSVDSLTQPAVSQQPVLPRLTVLVTARPRVLQAH